jgi:hypothetical protein
MSHSLLLVVKIALQGVNRVLLVTSLAGVKKTSQELEDGIGLPIVTVHFLEILIS